MNLAKNNLHTVGVPAVFDKAPEFNSVCETPILQPIAQRYIVETTITNYYYLIKY
jgi:hypothetical protein